MTGPWWWHRRRLRVRSGGRRTSAEARMRAHLLALGAWERTSAVGSGWRSAAAGGPLALREYIMRRPLPDGAETVAAVWEAVGLRLRDAALRWAANAEAAAEGWAAAARRWA